MGDKRNFKISFPDDYPVELWQGMQAKVDVSIREIFEWVLPQVSGCHVSPALPFCCFSVNQRLLLGSCFALLLLLGITACLPGATTCHPFTVMHIKC